MPAPRPAPPLHKIVRAGGAIVWRPCTDKKGASSRNEIEVLLVHRPKYGDWSWPKGKQEPGEHILACATREVEEETGIPVRLGASLTTQRYKLGRNTTKEVHYWVATPDLADAPLLARAPASRAPAREIDKTAWVKPGKALRLLTRRGDRRLLAEVLTRLDDDALATRPVVFVRHAKALKRSQWADKSESTRPLTRTGVHQVSRLTAVLSAYGIERVATSPWRRCLSTVAPYATLTGANLDMQPALTEDAYASDPQSFRQLIDELADSADKPLAVCVHRPTIPGIVGVLAPATPNHLGRLLPQSDPYLRTAEALVAHFTRGDKPRIVDLEVVRA